MEILGNYGVVLEFDEDTLITLGACPSCGESLESTACIGESIELESIEVFCTECGFCERLPCETREAELGLWRLT